MKHKKVFQNLIFGALLFLNIERVTAQLTDQVINIASFQQEVAHAVASNDVKILDRAIESLVQNRVLSLPEKVEVLWNAIESQPPESAAVGYLIDVVGLLGPAADVQTLINEFSRGRVGPKNSALLVRAVGNGHSSSTGPHQASAASPDVEKPKMFQVVPNSINTAQELKNPSEIKARDEKILSFLKQASFDKRPKVALEGILSYSLKAPSADAVALVREGYKQGVLPGQHYFRELILHLPNLSSVDQELLLDEMITNEAFHPNAAEPGTLTWLLTTFLADREFVSLISLKARQKADVYLQNRVPVFTTPGNSFDLISGVRYVFWLQARAWLTGVPEVDLPRYLLSHILSSQSDSNAVISVLISPFAAEVVAKATPGQKGALRATVLSHGKMASLIMTDTASSARDQALGALGS